MTRRLLVPLLAALACLAIAAPASAAGITGTWAGDTKQQLRHLDEPYDTDIVITAYKGRISGIVAEVRMECGESSILDARVVKSFRIGKGPALSAKGGFTTTVQGVKISGQLGSKAGGGVIAASKADCSGRGTWSVKRRKV